MNVSVIITDNFRREAKKLVKKHHSLKTELSEFEEELEKNPTQGVMITENTYKIRFAVKSKGKGKSGGLRIITYVYLKVQKDKSIEVYLLSIYDKSRIENISAKKLQQLILKIQQQSDEEE